MTRERFCTVSRVAVKVASFTPGNFRQKVLDTLPPDLLETMITRANLIAVIDMISDIIQKKQVGAGFLDGSDLKRMQKAQRDSLAMFPRDLDSYGLTSEQKITRAEIRFLSTLRMAISELRFITTQT